MMLMLFAVEGYSIISCSNVASSISLQEKLLDVWQTLTLLLNWLTYFY